MNLPNRFDLQSIQQAIRSVWERLDRYFDTTGNVRMSGNRVINAGAAQAPFDYVTLGQADERYQPVAPEGGDALAASIVDAQTGYRQNGRATAGHVLRGNGLEFVDAALAAADLSNGVTGTGAVVLNDSPQIENSLILDVVASPATSPAVALAGAGAGNVNTGAHTYAVTFTTATGETYSSWVNDNGSAVTVANSAVNGKVAVSSIPVSSHAGVTGRKLYRSKAGTTSPLYLLASIGDNTATTYTDNIADASLPATTEPAYNTTGGSIIAQDPASPQSAALQIDEFGFAVFRNWFSAGFPTNGTTGYLLGSSGADVAGAYAVDITRPMPMQGTPIITWNCATRAVTVPVTLDATTGFKQNGNATSGNYLRGNGTNFVSSAIQLADLPAGIVGGGGDTPADLSAFSWMDLNGTLTSPTPAGYTVNLANGYVAGANVWYDLVSAISGGATTFDFVIKFNFVFQSSNGAWGLVVHQASTNKRYYFYAAPSSGVYLVIIQRFTGHTWAGTTQWQVPAAIATTWWLRISGDGAKLHFYYGIGTPAAQYWLEVFNENLGTWLTPSHYGLMVDAAGASTNVISQFYNLTKTP